MHLIDDQLVDRRLQRFISLPRVILPNELPSVRELALQLAINPNTIQRAYRELEMQGWIATVAGKGCFVCGVPQMTPGEQQPLLAAFDKAAAALLALGVTKEELIRRLEQGGKENA